MFTRVIPTFALIAITAVMGCQAKLTVNKTHTIPDEEGRIAEIFSMPAQPGAQTITIKLNVKRGSNIDVFVLPDDLVGVDVGTRPDEKKFWEGKAFGSKRDIKSETMTVKIPANTKYKVVIMQTDSAKEKSEIETNITN